MRAATLAHRRDDATGAAAAIPLYRRALALAPGDPNVCILLANALLAVQPVTVEARLEAVVLAELGRANIESRAASPYEAATLYARYGHYLLENCSAFTHDDDDDSATAAASFQRELAAAVGVLERATTLAPSLVIAWKNLSVAYKLLRRNEDAATAMGEAVKWSRGKNARLLYVHAIALKRVHAWDAAANRYLDVLAARSGNEELAAYWVRVLLAAHASDLSAETKARAAGVPAVAAGDAAVPHTYIARLFDGYAKAFDHHLTGALGYRTPGVLAALALKHAGAAPEAGRPRWARCGDLGCGTGLAGVEVRRHVAVLEGVDLSAKMVGEAAERRLYDALDVTDIVTWLTAAAAAAKTYDLMLAADVFVYITDLAPVFAAVAAVAPPTGRSLFLFSTEADLTAPPASASATPTYRLTGTGRCVHARSYVERLTAEHGFRVVEVERRPIRRNAGEDVIGDLFVLERGGAVA